METKSFWGRLCPKLPRIYTGSMTALMLCAAFAVPAMAATNTAGNDMWTVAQNLIVDVYNHIAGISTVLAGLMSAISVIGVKLSGNQHKADQAWDWLKRIWVAWALLLGNLVFQALKSMAAGLGFEGEDPKLLFARTFVFTFLLLTSPQICRLGLDLTSSIMDLLQIPDATNVSLVDESVFGTLTASWLMAIICSVIVMFKVLGLVIEIAERYVILAMLALTAPLAFAMGGSKNTASIFTGWCRMFGSMCLLMVTNLVCFKMLFSVVSTVPSGLDVLPWMVLIFAIVKVAHKSDAIITRIGLNPAITGGGRHNGAGNGFQDFGGARGGGRYSSHSTSQQSSAQQESTSRSSTQQTSSGGSAFQGDRTHHGGGAIQVPGAVLCLPAPGDPPAMCRQVATHNRPLRQRRRGSPVHRCLTADRAAALQVPVPAAAQGAATYNPPADEPQVNPLLTADRAVALQVPAPPAGEIRALFRKRPALRRLPARPRPAPQESRPAVPSDLPIPRPGPAGTFPPSQRRSRQAAHLPARPRRKRESPPLPHRLR